MKNTIQKLIIDASQKAFASGDLPNKASIPPFTVENPREEKYGDFSTNIAMILAPVLSMKPRDIAEKVKKNFDGESRSISKVEIAGPGFINFFMSNGFWLEKLSEAIGKGDDFGRTDMGMGEKVLVEFVSANPTGPLHVGHGRGAVVGDVVSNVLEWAGYNVEREYYINDVGLQMKTLGLSALIRYKQLLGQKIELPDNSYKGEYLKGIAENILREKGECYKDTPDDDAVCFFSDYSSKMILDDIRNDLNDFGIFFDNWYSEKKLFEPEGSDGKNRVDAIIEWMKEKEFVYEKDDALWLRASVFGDEKDRVVKRGTGEYTYFASDIAYHKEKFTRGFQKIINVWGADHHGYVPRLRSAIKALDFPADAFQTILIQLVNLKKNGKIISMSTRAGKFEPLAELLDKVGKDAVRFFFLIRSSDAQLDFDVDLAMSQSSENPVYYVQYAHARICSVFRQAKEKSDVISDVDFVDTGYVPNAEELMLIKKILMLPELINRMASRLEPHLITHYLQDLAALFHSYYNKYRVVTDDIKKTKARLSLLKGVKIAIKNSLSILGVAAPEVM